MSTEEVPISAPTLTVSKELDYSKKETSHPMYDYTPVYPTIGASTLTLNQAGGQELVFQLPVAPINLSKSYIDLTLTPPVTAASTGFTGLAMWSHLTPFSMIRQMQLYTQSGSYLADLYYTNKYENVVFFAETPNDEFYNLPQINGGDTAMNAAQSLYKRTCLAFPAANVGLGPATVASYGYRVCTDNTGATVASGSTLHQVIISDPKERQYKSNQGFPTGATGSSNSQRNTLNISLPFKYLYNTVFSLDKDLYVGEVLQLRIVFDSVDQFCYAGTSLADANVGAVTLPTTLVPSSVICYTAIEKDVKIRETLIEKINSTGLVMPIPYVYTYKYSFDGSNQTISLRFNSAHGRKLRKIYSAPFQQNDTLSLAYCRDNTYYLTTSMTDTVLAAGSRAMLNYIYSMLNNVRINQTNIDCVKEDDWQIMRKKIEKSTYVTSTDYANNWFWVEDFTSEGPLISNESHDVNISSGIDLNTEQKYDIYYNLAASRTLTHYNFAITEKTLTILPGKVTVV